MDSFTGSHADLESAADNFFTSPLRPQPLPFSSMSIKTPAKTVPPTPGTALQQKIESNLEKSLANTLNTFTAANEFFPGIYVRSFPVSLRQLKNKQRWIRPRLQLLSLVPPPVLFIWTYPLRDPLRDQELEQELTCRGNGSGLWSSTSSTSRF